MENVYIFPMDEKTDRPNLCYIQGKEKSLLIDAGGGPKEYAFVVENLKKNHLSMPDYVLITHYHWDHMFGIGYFDAISIGSEYTNSKLLEMINLKPTKIEDFISDSMQPLFCLPHLRMEYSDLMDIKLKPIDKIVKREALDLGNRIVEIYEVPSPHTLGSLIVYDSISEILFLGDSVYGHIVGENFVEDISKLNELLDFISSIPYKYIVLGHAPMMKREELTAYLFEEEE